MKKFIKFCENDLHCWKFLVIYMALTLWNAPSWLFTAFWWFVGAFAAYWLICFIIAAVSIVTFVLHYISKESKHESE